jgi:hypothetical protein
MCLGFI